MTEFMASEQERTVQEPSYPWSELEVKRLLRLMNQLLAQYRYVLAASRLNKDGLVENDVQKMEQALADVTEHLDVIHQLESERQGLSEDMAAEARMDVAELTVPYLLTVLPPLQAQQLEKAAGELRVIFEEIAGLNRLNAELVNQSIHFFKKTLDIVTLALNSSNYGSKPANRASGRLFDTQV